MRTSNLKKKLDKLLKNKGGIEKMILKRRINEEWMELYNQQRARGMTVAEWCAEKEIKLATMADRITRLRNMGLIKEPKPTRGKNSVIEKKSEKQKTEWIPVEISDLSEPQEEKIRQSIPTQMKAERIEIQIESYIIRANIPLEDIIHVIKRCI